MSQTRSFIARSLIVKSLIVNDRVFFHDKLMLQAIYDRVKGFGFAFTLLVLVFSQQVLATQVTVPEIKQMSAAAQQQLIVCKSCHGADLHGQEALKAPAIAGQSAVYLTNQISKFQQKFRGAHAQDIAGQQMAEIATSLNDITVIEEINLYLSQLTYFPSAASINNPLAPEQVNALAKQLKQGSNYYQAKCGACHGGQGQGNDRMSAPRLNNLSSWYISKQMDNFVNGIRGEHPKDKYGRQMAMMAKTSRGQELENIIAFITQINNSREQQGVRNGQ